MTLRDFIQRIARIAKRETFRIMSRPIYLFGMILAPVISLVFFLSLMHEGLPTNLPIAVVDRDNTTTSRTLIRQLDAFEQTHVVMQTYSFAEARKEMQKGNIYGIFYIPENFLTILGCIWITGFVVIFTIQVISHLRFTKKLRENSRSVGDDSLLEQWNKMKKDMEIPLAVDIRYCSEIKTPLTLGIRMKNTTAYLPERSFTDEEAELIFAHELHHIRRRDTHMKFFLRFCCAFGWIHPLVWMAVRKAEDDLELSCDEIVLKGADKEKRRRYAELLLSIAGDSRGFSVRQI